MACLHTTAEIALLLTNMQQSNDYRTLIQCTLVKRKNCTENGSVLVNSKYTQVYTIFWKPVKSLVKSASTLYREG